MQSVQAHRTRRAGTIRRRLPKGFAVLLAWWQQCRARAAQRRALTVLSDWGLQDIGITRAEADGESGKWPWHP